MASIPAASTPSNGDGEAVRRLRQRLLELLAHAWKVAELSEHQAEAVAVTHDVGVVLAVGLEVRCQRLLEVSARGGQLAEVSEYQCEVAVATRDCGVVLAEGLEVRRQ